MANNRNKNRVHQFEENERHKAARDEEEGDSDDDEEALEFRRLEAGAYTQQRLAVVMVVTAAHSSAVAQRINEKLHQVCVRTGSLMISTPYVTVYERAPWLTTCRNFVECNSHRKTQHTA